jgi:hypothetical protein
VPSTLHWLDITFIGMTASTLLWLLWGIARLA